MTATIEKVHEPARWLAVTTFEADAAHIAEAIGPAFGSVVGYLGRHGIPITGPAVARYEMAGDHFVVAAGFAVGASFAAGDGVAPLELPETEALTTLHTGPYSGLEEVYADLQADAGHRQVELARASWEEYLDGPDVPAEETRTRIVWPLAADGDR